MVENPVVVLVMLIVTPAGHEVQMDWPIVEANIPWGQGVHTVTPGEDEYEPIGHGIWLPLTQ